MSEKLPLEVYTTAVSRVPAYGDFIRKQYEGVIPEVKTMDDFYSLPFMEKSSYIRSYPLLERCMDGCLDSSHMLSHSSGSSGRHLYWPLSRDGEKDFWMKTRDELEQKYQIHSKKTLVVLAVMMGGNLSGSLYAYALRAVGLATPGFTLVTPGKDDSEAVEVLQEFSPHYDQTIIYSYGVSARNMLERAAADGVPIKDFHIKLRLLGEGYSESYRDRINELLGYPYGALDSIGSGYGATDFRSGGRETTLCVAIKRLLHENNMLERVFGVDTMPTICQYVPSDIFIESHDGELVMTRHNVVPLVRYVPGDEGFVMTYDQVMERMNSHGLDPLKLMEERKATQLANKAPFVFVAGRTDGIKFCGTKIFVAKVKGIIEEVPELSACLTGEFQLRSVADEQDRPHLEIDAVARVGAFPDAERVSEVMADALSRKQGGLYASLLETDRTAALPHVRFVAREEIMTPTSYKIRWVG